MTPQATFEDVVACKTGRDLRIGWVTPMPYEAAYLVEFQDDEPPIKVSWWELRRAGVPDLDLAVYMGSTP